MRLSPLAILPLLLGTLLQIQLKFTPKLKLMK
nr:MAG TPA: hypothetical protein [Caudoviricetes sp.]